MWSYKTAQEGDQTIERMNAYKPGWGDSVAIHDSGEDGWLDQAEREARIHKRCHHEPQP
jgi:hypothetical protein